MFAMPLAAGKTTVDHSGRRQSNQWTMGRALGKHNYNRSGRCVKAIARKLGKCVVRHRSIPFVPEGDIDAQRPIT